MKRIGYYIHHEGSGHIQRALAVAPFMKNCEVTYFSSHPRGKELNPFGKVIELPLDTDEPYYANARISVRHSHLYAPFYSRGNIHRLNLILKWIEQNHPHLFHVDVSTEVAEFITLCGLPFTYVRQSGYRLDGAHQRIYQMSQGLLAPFPQWMDSPDHQRSFPDTRYHAITSTNFSKCESKSEGILYIRSSTETDSSVLSSLESALNKLGAKYRVQVAGTPVPSSMPQFKNIGWSSDLNNLIKEAEIILSSVGNNTILDLLNTRKPLIMIPERKPFQEQLYKAQAINKYLGIPFIEIDKIQDTSFLEVIKDDIFESPSRYPTIDNEAQDFAESILFWT